MITHAIALWEVKASDKPFFESVEYLIHGQDCARSRENINRARILSTLFRNIWRTILLNSMKKCKSYVVMMVRE
jgi:hypothetical protein